MVKIAISTNGRHNILTYSNQIILKEEIVQPCRSVNSRFKDHQDSRP